MDKHEKNRLTAKIYYWNNRERILSEQKEKRRMEKLNQLVKSKKNQYGFIRKHGKITVDFE